MYPNITRITLFHKRKILLKKNLPADRELH